MPWFSTLHIWEFIPGKREIHRHEIDDLPTLEQAMMQELRFGRLSVDTLAVCKTDDADEIGLMLSKKLGLPYTIGNGIYPTEEEVRSRRDEADSQA